MLVDWKHFFTNTFYWPFPFVSISPKHYTVVNYGCCVNLCSLTWVEPFIIFFFYSLYLPSQTLSNCLKLHYLTSIPLTLWWFWFLLLWRTEPINTHFQFLTSPSTYAFIFTIKLFLSSSHSWQGVQGQALEPIHFLWDPLCFMNVFFSILQHLPVQQTGSFPMAINMLRSPPC